MIAPVATQAQGPIWVRHRHMAIIDIIAEATPTGIWAMEDWLYHSKEHLLTGETSFVIDFGHCSER